MGLSGDGGRHAVLYFENGSRQASRPTVRAGLGKQLHDFPHSSHLLITVVSTVGLIGVLCWQLFWSVCEALPALLNRNQSGKFQLA